MDSPVDDRRQPRPRGWAVGRVAGVPVLVRPAALVTAVLLWGLLHAQLAPAMAPRGWGVAAAVTTAVTIGFGASVLIHELAHALVARSLGLPVTSITIFHLGGVTQLAQEPGDPRDETFVAVAGPLVNLTVAGGCLAAGALAGQGTIPAVVLILVGYLNASIGVFNLLPGHPLDGGSLLRAAAWAVTGDAQGALRVSARLGQALGISMLVGGVVGALPQAPGGGDASWLWLALVGAFVLHGARIGVVRATVRSALGGVSVAELTRASAFDADGRTTVGAVVAAVSRAGTPGVVLDGRGQPIGAFGPAQLADVPQGQWSHLTISESMHPILATVRHDDAVLDVVADFQGDRDAVLAVTRGGSPIGTLAAEDVLAHVDEPPTGARGPVG